MKLQNSRFLRYAEKDDVDVGSEMNILAIDTSLERCSVALRKRGSGDADTIATETIGRGHAELLPSMVSEVLLSRSLKPGDIHRIGVVCGPGSFAGLRVGLAMARGMALVNKAELVGVPTLSALARAAVRTGIDRPIFAVQDARRGEFFVQTFDAEGFETGLPCASSLADLAGLLPKGAVVTGSGASLVFETYETGSSLELINAIGAPDIEAVIDLVDAAKAPFVTADPIYLRGPDAKKQMGFAVAHA